jgi:acetyl-CoA carboxylase carboxyltransferase component
VARLADPGSFHELGKIAGRATYDARNNLESLTPSNFIFGRARVDGRPVIIGGDDFTVRGGSADATIKGKHNMCERMAHDLRLPLIRWSRASGGGGSVKTIETTGRANVPGVAGWEWVVNSIGTVPRVALGLGSVAGLGAAHLAAAHLSVMVKDKSALFVAGPPVVERLGQKLTKNELGGWQIQLKAGAVDQAVDTEEEAFAVARRFLSYLPSSIYELPPRGPQTDDRERREEWLSDAVPRDIRKPYKMRAIVEPWSTAARSSRCRRCTAAPSSPASPASTAGRWRSWPPTRSTTAARGRPTPARRSSASWTSRRPSTCPSRTSATVPASSSGSRRSRPAPSSRASARCPPCGSARCRGAR